MKIVEHDLQAEFLGINFVVLTKEIDLVLDFKQIVSPMSTDVISMCVAPSQ